MKNYSQFVNQKLLLERTLSHSKIIGDDVYFNSEKSDIILTGENRIALDPNKVYTVVASKTVKVGFNGHVPKYDTKSEIGYKSGTWIHNNVDLINKIMSDNIFPREFDRDDYKLIDIAHQNLKGKNLYIVLVLNSDDDSLYKIISTNKSYIDNLTKRNPYKAADWEKIITTTWNSKVAKMTFSTYEPKPYEKFKIIISNSKYRNMVNVDPSFIFKMLETEKKYKLNNDDIVMDLKNKMSLNNVNNLYMRHLGSSTKYNTTTLWNSISIGSEYKNIDKTPKTDILLLNYDNDNVISRISLKKSGDSQLISSSKNDTKRILHSVLNEYSGVLKPKIEKLTSEIFSDDNEKWFNKKMKNTIGYYGKVFFDVKFPLVKDYIETCIENGIELPPFDPKSKINLSNIDPETKWEELTSDERKYLIDNFDKEVAKDEEWDQSVTFRRKMSILSGVKEVMYQKMKNYDLTKDINDMLRLDDEFRKAILFECATGTLKFGENSPACADKICIYDEGAGDVQYGDIKHFLNDWNKKFNFEVTFKSTNLNALNTLRVKVFESIDMDEILNESWLDTIGQGIRNVGEWIKNLFKSMLEKVKKWIGDSIDRLLALFGYELDDIQIVDYIDL